MASCAVRGHALLAGKLVGAHLQAYDVTSLPELLWSKAALLFLSVLHS